MTKKIFKSNILVAVVVLIFGIACVMAILYQHFGKQIDTELKKEATYLAYGVERNGMDYLNQIKEKDDRITYIAEDGTVLYDNQADSSSMENHSDRKEVQEALKSGSGRAERDSKTLSCTAPLRQYSTPCFQYAVLGMGASYGDGTADDRYCSRDADTGRSCIYAYGK